VAPRELEELARRVPLAGELALASRKPAHAYMLIGRDRALLAELTSAFAQALICEDGGCGTCKSCSSIANGEHPDLVVYEHRGSYWTIGEVHEVIQRAIRRPLVAPRQVLVMEDVHLGRNVLPALLKTVEEPGARTIFVFWSDLLTPGLSTLASRCVVLHVSSPAVPERGALASDDLNHGSGQMSSWEKLVDLFREIPSLLNGTGAKVEELVSQIQIALEEASKGSEVPGGQAFSSCSEPDKRRARREALGRSLSELAHAWLAHQGPGAKGASGLAAIEELIVSLDRNPNETLGLEALLLRLSLLD
jgi:hypothetical protein